MVLMTLEGLFKPTVMFFRLMNTLVIIIDKILQDLINTGEVASFINDIIVEIEEEEEHDKVVEEVIKKLVENDLYIKPEKYKWKVKKVRFLEVVIRPEGIKWKRRR